MINIIGATLLLLFLIYAVYQLIHNSAVYKIRIKWINENRWSIYYKYTYDEMFDPNKSNWYGLKFPKESDYLKGGEEK